MDKYLDLAISEAQKSLDNGDYPVGAVLTIAGEIVGSKNNTGESTLNYSNHAETQLVLDKSKALLDAWKNGRESILYSTLEPCLMCLGVSTMNKVSKIYFIQKDPHAGACGINVGDLGIRYQENFPKIEKVKYSEKPKKFIIQFLKNQIEKDMRVEWSQKLIDLFLNEK